MPVQVKVRYMGLLRNTAGIPVEEVALPDGSGVGELLALLQQKHDDNFRYSLFSSNGQLRPMARVFIGEQEIGEMEGLNTPLGSESEVSILVMVHPSAGG